jgi:hypothetical protein
MAASVDGGKRVFVQGWWVFSSFWSGMLRGGLMRKRWFARVCAEGRESPVFGFPDFARISLGFSKKLPRSFQTGERAVSLAI